MGENIFINYRREEAQSAAGRLYDLLESTFGREHIFFDVDSIAPGRDFVEELSARVSECDIFLAVIGRGWIEVKDYKGGRRIDNPTDWVRIEIESALEQKKHVIPVLVDGAEMPRAESLPASLTQFVRRNAVRLTHDRFKSDVHGLVGAMKKLRADWVRQEAEQRERRAEEEEAERRRAAEEEAHRKVQEAIRERQEAERTEAERKALAQRQEEEELRQRGETKDAACAGDMGEAGVADVKEEDRKQQNDFREAKLNLRSNWLLPMLGGIFFIVAGAIFLVKQNVSRDPPAATFQSAPPKETAAPDASTDKEASKDVRTDSDPPAATFQSDPPKETAAPDTSTDKQASIDAGSHSGKPEQLGTYGEWGPTPLRVDVTEPATRSGSQRRGRRKGSSKTPPPMSLFRRDRPRISTTRSQLIWAIRQRTAQPQSPTSMATATI